MNNFLNELFALLSDNLSFPYYQGERRIDVFINFFIEDIIRQHTTYRDAIYVAPEFPLKKNDSSDHAAHIDYLMYSEAQNTVLLVELKTDDTSFLDEQILFYLEHPGFLSLYQKSMTIKMKGYADKKKKLKEKIEGVIRDLSLSTKVAVVVLKPSIYPKDQHMASQFKNQLVFIPLFDVDIKTNHQEEWDCFRKEILLKLRTKRVSRNV